MPDFNYRNKPNKNREVTCLNCYGNGYISKRYVYTYPVTCPGCKGTGKQVVNNV